MKKCLLLAALMVLQLSYVKAQNLFNAPDTVCIRQPIQLTSNVAASTYYWGFCSGFLFDQPQGNNLGVIPGFDNPGAIEIAREGNKYYGFVANTGNNEILRLDYGISLSNTPVVTSLGTLNNTMPEIPSKLYLTKDVAGNWFMFVCGGTTATNSSLARLDFGGSLSNMPNSVNFGNLGNVLNAPRGIFVLEEAGNYIGYVANNADNRLIKLDFGNNISLTPNVIDLGPVFALTNPSDMVAVKEANDWYVFVTNQGSNSITRLDYGASVADTPVANDLGTMGNRLFGPSSITFARDCGFIHLFVTNAVSSDITMINMPGILGPYTATIFTGVGGMALPTSISRIIREKDNIYTYVTNGFGNTLSQVVFPSCTTATVTSSTLSVPPSYSYSVPGTYNVYFVTNEGQPDMQVQCQQIVALPIPQMTISNDTVICQGDTIELFAQAFGSLSTTWSPNYNIDDTSDFAVKVWPDYTTEYHVVLPYANGCIVDTPVNVTVHKNRADAGPDRIIFDGATTLLGGPFTSYSDTIGLYTYTWFPNEYITDTTIMNPVAAPPNDFVYYLEIRDKYGCYDIDTVVVRVDCNNLNLPNAFAPESRHPETNSFGILNNQIVKLNYFRIFDRWGKEVFSTNDPKIRWNGLVDGEPAAVGVYIWEADGFCFEGQRFKRSGNVTLLR